MKSLSRVSLYATPCTAACQTPLSVGFSRQKYQSVLPCPPPGDLPNSGTEPTSLASPIMAGRFFTTSITWEALLSARSPGKSEPILSNKPLSFSLCVYTTCWFCCSGEPWLLEERFAKSVLLVAPGHRCSTQLRGATEAFVSPGVPVQWTLTP